MAESKEHGPDYTLVYTEIYDQELKTERGLLELWDAEEYHKEQKAEDPDYDGAYDTDMVVTVNFPKAAKQRVFLLNDDGAVEELSIVNDDPMVRETPEQALDTLEKHVEFLESPTDGPREERMVLPRAYAGVLMRRLQHARRVFSKFGCTLCCVVDTDGRVIADREILPTCVTKSDDE